MEEEKPDICCKKKQLRFWKWTMAAVILRLMLSYFSKNLSLSSRPEVSTPLTSLRRLAEGYWLKQLSMSPYSGSMYHGSPLLLSILGPLTYKKVKGQTDHLLCSLVSVVADFTSAILIRATGQSLVTRRGYKLKKLGLIELFKDMEVLPSGDIAALVYLWNPFSVVSCVGFNTSPIENLFIIVSLYGASSGKAPLAAFGWAVASHLSLYPLILVIPVILLLGYGSDVPPRKLFMQCMVQVEKVSSADDAKSGSLTNKTVETIFSWRQVILFSLWASLWISYMLILCAVYMKEYGGLGEMFKRTYGFILTVEDLSPNIGVL